MPTPTKKRILEKARELFHRKESGHRHETVTNPEESELRESGYMEQAKTELMQGEPSQIAAQQDYLKQAGPEVGMKVMHESEFSDIQLGTRRNRWEARAFKEAAKKGTLVITQPKTTLKSRFGSALEELRTPYPKDHPTFPTDIQVAKFKSGFSGLFRGDPQKQAANKARKETYRLIEAKAHESGKRKGIYDKAYRESYKREVMGGTGIFGTMSDISSQIGHALDLPSQVYPPEARRVRRTNRRHKKRSVRKKQSNDWLW